MKINWFTPLPPARTEIANYSIKILPILQDFADIRVWTNQDYWDSKLNDAMSVRYCRYNYIPWSEINEADLNIYQLGNNHLFHRDIWKISTQCPGLVVLHDYKLQDFFYMLSVNEQQVFNKQEYLHRVFNIYGMEGLNDANKFLNGLIPISFMANKYPMTSLALKGAIGVLTHNYDSYNSLSNKNQFITGYTPLPYLVDNPTQINSRKSQIPYQIIMIGFMGHNRCLTSVFHALAMVTRKDKFHLNIYGEIPDKDCFLKQIKELGLEKIVTLQGFVSEQELNTALCGANLAINLRNPSMGEASASQLHLWSYALPTIVSQTEWYSNLNPQAVAFVRPNHEIEDLVNHLNDFLDQPQKFAQMGIEGKKTLQQHHQPQACAQAILNLAQQVIQYRPTHTINTMATRIGKQLSYFDLPPSNDINRYSKIIDFICKSIPEKN
ncbi:glycosyltransferase [Cyanobacterium stanieri LEGE 03274]|uniref:Glycosyltransferase n=1 Tax=Cyanobacterium stanieri LEGE 03274 TaxID=1828756 RepID=A0ABR9V7F4_9CHRO|nr:glycosyltransferase [Cyanobacterium stanieri]MBE9223826.1 glycosyltransferase [Cyanobacterium stanieri LEGE 03274]